MGRMAELWQTRRDIEQEISIAKMEAEHEAIPKTLSESLEVIKELKEQIKLLFGQVKKSNSRMEKNKERFLGFIFGIIASIMASFLV